MGQDIGFIASRSAIGEARLLDAAQRTCPNPRGVSVLATWHGVLELGPAPGIEIVTLSVSHAAATALLPIDAIAERLSADDGATVVAAFMADHYQLGGYRSWSGGRVARAQLFSPTNYIDGARRALEELSGDAIAVTDRERLRFTEVWIWKHCSGKRRTRMLALDGRWLAVPQPIELEGFSRPSRGRSTRRCLARCPRRVGGRDALEWMGCLHQTPRNMRVTATSRSDV